MVYLLSREPDIFLLRLKYVNCLLVLSCGASRACDPLEVTYHSFISMNDHQEVNDEAISIPIKQRCSV